MMIVQTAMMFAITCFSHKINSNHIESVEYSSNMSNDSPFNSIDSQNCNLVHNIDNPNGEKKSSISTNDRWQQELSTHDESEASSLLKLYFMISEDSPFSRNKNLLKSNTENLTSSTTSELQNNDSLGLNKSIEDQRSSICKESSILPTPNPGQTLERKSNGNRQLKIKNAKKFAKKAKLGESNIDSSDLSLKSSACRNDLQDSSITTRCESMDCAVKKASVDEVRNQKFNQIKDFNGRLKAAYNRLLMIEKWANKVFERKMNDQESNSSIDDDLNEIKKNAKYIGEIITGLLAIFKKNLEYDLVDITNYTNMVIDAANSIYSTLYYFKKAANQNNLVSTKKECEHDSEALKTTNNSIEGKIKALKLNEFTNRVLEMNISLINGKESDKVYDNQTMKFLFEEKNNDSEAPEFIFQLKTRYHPVFFSVVNEYMFTCINISNQPMQILKIHLNNRKKKKS